MRTRLELPEEQRIVVYTGWAGTIQATHPIGSSKPWRKAALWRKVETEAVIDHDRAGVIATLERVRAQLKAEKADAASTVRKSWQLISEAIEHLRADDSMARDDRPEMEAPEQADDLTSIRGVSAALAGHLASLGVTRYVEIAAWRSDDVRNVAQALGLTREISRQNWIEQAAMLEHRKTIGATETTGDRAASTPEAANVVAPAAGRDIDLPEILEAIRKDEPGHEAASASLAVEHVPLQLRESADADAKPLAAPSAPPTPAVPGTEQVEAARAEPIAGQPTASTSHGARIPTVTASPHVSTGASERVKRLEEERQRLARNLERADRQATLAEEAAVTFVIREEAQSQQPDAGSWLPPRGTPFVDSPQRAGAQDTGPARYVMNAAEEAEVVVVKPQAHSFPNPLHDPKRGSVRRFLKALTGR